MFSQSNCRRRSTAAASISTHPSDAHHRSLLRPIDSRLCTYDYWQLNEHRRRLETVGTASSLRLSRLIRAKLNDAEVIEDVRFSSGIVAGGSLVRFAISGSRPQLRRLYHWRYPENDCSRLAVNTFLGVSLIGMSVGQRTYLLDDVQELRTLEVLAVD